METELNLSTRRKPILDFFKSWNFWRPFLGVATGGTAGFLYWYFIGCNSGTCPITSNPFGSIIAGALLGFLITPSRGRAGKEKQN